MIHDPSLNESVFCAPKEFPFFAESVDLKCLIQIAFHVSDSCLQYSIIWGQKILFLTVDCSPPIS